MNAYIQAIQKDKSFFESYYTKSLKKTEQQKLLENLLRERIAVHEVKQIADIACGGGIELPSQRTF